MGDELELFNKLIEDFFAEEKHKKLSPSELHEMAQTVASVRKKLDENPVGAPPSAANPIFMVNRYWIARYLKEQHGETRQKVINNVFAMSMGDDWIEPRARDFERRHDRESPRWEKLALRLELEGVRPISDKWIETFFQNFKKKNNS